MNIHKKGQRFERDSDLIGQGVNGLSGLRYSGLPTLSLTFDRPKVKGGFQKVERIEQCKALWSETLQKPSQGRDAFGL